MSKPEQNYFLRYAMRYPVVEVEKKYTFIQIGSGHTVMQKWLHKDIEPIVLYSNQPNGCILKIAASNLKLIFNWMRNFGSKLS